MNAAEKNCPIPDCGKPQSSRGYCQSHYQRLRRYGDPMGGRTPPGEPERYFREVVLAYDGDECLTWPYGKDGRGYGTIWHDGRSNKVHRRVCEEVNGPPPTPEYQAAHSCGNGHEACCAKRHVAWKTPSENAADRLIHGTAYRGERHVNAKLTSDQALEIRSLRGIEPQRSIAVRLGVSPACVGAIQTGRKWSWL